MPLNEIKDSIERILRQHAKASEQNVSVKVRHGTVTLTGTVHSWSEGELAKQSAWSADGVNDVVDGMTIV